MAVAMVKFPDGSEEPKPMVDEYFSKLFVLFYASLDSVRCLVKLCQDESCEIPKDIEDDLIAREFIYGPNAHHPFPPGTRMHPSIKKIILAMVTTEADGRIAIDYI